MSDLDDRIFDEEEEIIENDTNINNEIINTIATEKNNESIIESIEKFYKENNINSTYLIKKTEECFKAKRIDFLNIQEIAKLALEKSIPSQIENNLIEFYDFISDKDLPNDIINLIYKKKYFYEKGDFKEIFKKVKIDIIIKAFNIDDDYIKKLYIKCIELNWKIDKIYDFVSRIKILYPNNEKDIKDSKKLELIQNLNEQKLHIIETLTDSLTAFPDIKIESLEDINFDDLSTIARDFYLKCSSESKDDINPLTTSELIDSLQLLNKNYFSIEKIKQFNEQINICNNMKNNIKPKDIKNWINCEFKKYDFEKMEEKYRNIAKTIGVISIGLYDYVKNEKEKFYLRDAQILAILIFIDNYEENIEKGSGTNNVSDEQLAFEPKGLIEEISTGEGKSSIICCLAAYFGLRKHKVDIITSSKTLAERDAIKYKKFYDIFFLEDDYCKNYDPAPYKANIIYGTFLDFEGDLLDEISNNNIIRGDRNYDIIIIDEVDNMFIDGIKGSTQLTHSSKGYQFLIPIYLSIYLFVDILDHLYLDECKKQYEKIISENNYKNLSNDSKNKIFNKLTNESERKDVFLKYIEKIIQDLLKEIEKKNPKYANQIKENLNNDLNKINSINNEEDNEKKLKKFFTFPFFLYDFVQSQMNLWVNNAYMAKNLFKRETHYTISNKRYGYDNITPIDRKNTGELELNTVYRNGLHQMLQVKENIKVQSESLTHTFLSHISYFQNFRKGNFFGLTGTIGGEETLSIYKSKYFNSNLVRIPQYKRKRFIELPAVICENDETKHLLEICKEIIYHFSIGRKILIICKDINEGNNIKLILEEGKFEFHKKDLGIEIDKSYKDDIFLYLRNDLDNLENDLKTTTKRIILSTNLGGRGTDIGTTIDIENKGGLHVIITKLSQNSRTQKQAFGRTSRQGKKGSGQFIITKKNELNTYNKLIVNRDKNEEKRLKSINLDFLLLKDKLFFKYTKHLKKFPELKDNEFGNCLKNDIDERWSFFLKKHLNEDENDNENLDKIKINKEFDNFLREIDKIMKLPRHERFNNNFLRISDGVKNNHNFNPDLEKYLDFEDNDQCFYFAVSYDKALIEHYKYRYISNDIDSDNKYCLKIIENLNNSKEQLKALEELNIEPTLKSFIDWEQLSKVDKYFIHDSSNKNYQESGFYLQFKHRKCLLNKLIEHINLNINVVDEFIKKYLPKNKKKIKQF